MPEENARNAAGSDDAGMDAAEMRSDQLRRASGSTDADEAPRITVTEKADGVTRVDIADTAAVRPGEPEEP